jgi:hypothetical protein
MNPVVASQMAGWRRQTAALYARVREQADPVAAHALSRDCQEDFSDCRPGARKDDARPCANPAGCGTRRSGEERNTMHRLKSRALGIALGGAVLVGLAVGFTGAASASAATLNGGGYAAGWVYTSTNATGGNQVEVFARQPDGTLKPAGSYNTGGTGTGASGFSQGAVTLSRISGHCSWWTPVLTRSRTSPSCPAAPSGCGTWSPAEAPSRPASRSAAVWSRS